MILENTFGKIERSTKVEPLAVGVKNSAVILQILCTKLYSNPLKVVVQEYMCNARDAHRERGNADVPITIILPTKLFPTLKITDTGVGISPERVRDVFVFLGESTKLDTDDQTGGHGLGAKTAWSYTETESFTVRTIYANIEYTYIMYIGEGGEGFMELLHTKSTDEGNGTTIEIDIKVEDLDRTEQYVYATGFFWDVRPHIKNPSGRYEFDCPVHHFTSENGNIIGSYIGEISDARKNTYLSHLKNKLSIVVDGIIYKQVSDTIEIPDDCKILVPNNAAIFVHFKTSELKPAINRENVIINSLYTNIIIVKLSEFINIITRDINNDTSVITTLPAFLEYIKSNDVGYLDIVPNWEIYINGVCIKYNSSRKFYIKIDSNYITCQIYFYKNTELRYDSVTQYISLNDLAAGNVFVNDKFIKTINKPAIKYHITNVNQLKTIRIITKVYDSVNKDDILREQGDVLQLIQTLAINVSKLQEDMKGIKVSQPSYRSSMPKGSMKVKTMDYRHVLHKSWQHSDVLDNYNYICDSHLIIDYMQSTVNRLFHLYNEIRENKFAIVTIHTPTRKYMPDDIKDKLISPEEAVEFIVNDIFNRLTSYDFINIHQYDFNPENYKYISYIDSPQNDIHDVQFIKTYRMYNKFREKLCQRRKKSPNHSHVREVYEAISRYKSTLSNILNQQISFPCEEQHIVNLIARKSRIIEKKCGGILKKYPLLITIHKNHHYGEVNKPCIDYINAMYQFKTQEM